MSRPLRDRLAECIRVSRIGAQMRPFWGDLPEATKEDWRKSADTLVSLGKSSFGFSVFDGREGDQ